MKHLISPQDQTFKSRIESDDFPVAEFDHRAHLRLAYIYLAQNNAEQSVNLMRTALMGLLKKAGIEPSQKFHETLTEAWVLAVNHFMNKTEVAHSGDEFIDKNKEMLDSNIMLTHYSVELLFSDEARKSFVEPDLESIPKHNKSSF